MDKPEGERSRAATIFNIVMLLVGGVALYLMLREHGWSEFQVMIANVGWWFAVVLGLELVSLCMDAAAVHAFMRPEARMISYWWVLGAQSSGRAINVLTPGGALGEATKLIMLSAHAPRARALSSLVLFNLAIAYVAMTVMIVGIPITLLVLDVPHAIKVVVVAGLAVLVPAMIALTVVIHRGALTTIVDLIKRLHIIGDARAKSWRERLVDVDKHIRELHRNRSAGTWKGILWVIASKLVSWTSSIVLVAAVGVPISPTLVLGVLSVGLLIGWIANIAPLGLGLQDGGNYALFGILGATGPQGLLVAMLQRARSVCVAVLGLGAYATVQIINRLAQSKIRKKIEDLRAQQAAT
jgi:hypothetical protein